MTTTTITSDVKGKDSSKSNKTIINVIQRDKGFQSYDKLQKVISRFVKHTAWNTLSQTNAFVRCRRCAIYVQIKKVLCQKCCFRFSILLP